MSDLKEMIQRKFEHDVVNADIEATKKIHRNNAEGMYGFCVGAEWQHNQLKSEVLPILLECVEALEFYANHKSWLLEPAADIARRIEAEDCNLVQGYSEFTGGKLAREALERLRKWSEG